jgi:CubicO group peptidase (beta-lactamase class C family)
MHSFRITPTPCSAYMAIDRHTTVSGNQDGQKNQDAGCGEAGNNVIETFPSTTISLAMNCFSSKFAPFATLLLSLTVSSLAQKARHALPAGNSIDAEAKRAMASTHANGLAIAVIDHGKVGYVQAYGIRNAKGEPLSKDTVMYAASLTKMVFAYHVMQLVDQGKIKLDTPFKDDFDKPLIEYGAHTDEKFLGKYGPYTDLADDPRWEKLTPRMSLTHSTGFANFWFMEPGQKLRIHFDPGTQFSYSGEGLSLLQFAIEHGKKSQGLGLDVDDLTMSTFTRLGMTRTRLMWRPDFASDLADGWNDKGEPQPHDERSKVRVAGSMDTTITDLAKFVAALVRGDGMSKASRAEMTKPQLHLTTAHQFPNFGPVLPASEQRKDLYAGLGVIVFDGPQGHGFFKGGHNEQTANTVVCVEKSQRCAVILSNDVRAEASFADIVKFILGDTEVPYDWEYGEHAGMS